MWTKDKALIWSWYWGWQKTVHNFLWAVRSGFPTTNFRNHSPSWPSWLPRWHEDKSEYKNKRLTLWRTIHSYSFYWMNKRHLRTTWNWLVLRQRIVTKVRLTSCCQSMRRQTKCEEEEGEGKEGGQVVERRNRRVRTPVRAFPRNFLTRRSSPTWQWQQQKEYKVGLQRTSSDKRLLTRSGKDKNRICGQRCFWRD